jgi:hypothetical protein
MEFKELAKNFPAFDFSKVPSEYAKIMDYSIE